MRKVSGVLLAVAMMLPLGIWAAGPASAAGGTVCATTGGLVTWTPPLPVKVAVKTHISATGTFGKCTGPVASAHTVLTSPVGKTPSSCATTLKYSTGAEATGTLTVTWNKGAKSVIAVSIFKVKGKATQALVTGTVKSGQFAGLKSSGTVQYTPKVGNCGTTALKSATYTQVGSLKIG
jgi:hypothetical protein